MSGDEDDLFTMIAGVGKQLLRFSNVRFLEISRSGLGSVAAAADEIGGALVPPLRIPKTGGEGVRLIGELSQRQPRPRIAERW